MRLLNRDRYVLRLPCDRLTALGTLRSYTSNKTLNSRGATGISPVPWGRTNFA